MNKTTFGLIGLLIVIGVAVFFSGNLIGGKSMTMSEENAAPPMEKSTTKAPVSESDSMSTSEVMNSGNTADDFSLMDTKGNTITLSDLKGEKVYLKFWASWCSICLAGLEDVNDLSAEMNGFKVITIVSPGFKGEQSKEDFIQWFEGVDAKDMIVLLDVNGDIAKAYGIRAYPTSYYIGSDGILVKSQIGHTDNNAIKAVMADIK